MDYSLNPVERTVRGTLKLDDGLGDRLAFNGATTEVTLVLQPVITGR